MICVHTASMIDIALRFRLYLSLENMPSDPKDQMRYILKGIREMTFKGLVCTIVE